MKVVALAGGVGGAKFVDGLSRCMPAEDLTVIVNTGDDFSHFGLAISPDLDTVCYTLAEIVDSQTGYGLREDTNEIMNMIRRLGGPGWFNIGDRDFATHLERTRLLQSGWDLSQITQKFCSAWGVKVRVLPMSNQPVRTLVHTRTADTLGFQEYFVREQCQPEILGFTFQGVEQAVPAPGVIEACEQADVVIFAPSNPWVSINPILSVAGILETVRKRKVIAISPIIAGKTVKGPAAKMFLELGISPSALAVAEMYEEFLSGFIFDLMDAQLEAQIKACGIMTLITNTIMKTQRDRARLAQEVLDFASLYLHQGGSVH